MRDKKKERKRTASSLPQTDSPGASAAPGLAVGVPPAQDPRRATSGRVGAGLQRGLHIHTVVIAVDDDELVRAVAAAFAAAAATRGH